MTEVALVTGALGLNGSWVVRSLLQQGYEVIGYDRSNDVHLVSDIEGPFDIVRGGLGDRESLEALLRARNVTHLVHFAAVLSAACMSDPELAVKVNGLGTINVLSAATRVGIRRVVYASSLSVYGALTGPFVHPEYAKVDESRRYPMISGQRIYGATKLLGEELGLNMVDSGGPSFVALRFAHILGSTRTARHSGQASYHVLLDEMAEGRPVKIQRGGDQKFDLLYIKDLCNAVVLACAAADTTSGVYNIGTGRGISLHSVANSARRRIPDARVEIGPGLDFMNLGPMYPVFDISKAHTDLGYQPRYGLDAAVDDYLDSKGVAIR